MSFLLSFALYPKMSNALSSNAELIRVIATYTDSANLLGNLNLSKLNVNTLSINDINTIVEKANLPSPLNDLLRSNLAQKVFAPLGDLATTVGDYVNQTLISTSINVLSFLICFLACFLAITIIINLIRKVFKLPVLHLLDSLAGGLAGFATGILICLALFTVLPLIQSVIPVQNFDAVIESSKFAAYFQKDGLIISIMNRKLF